MNLRDLALSKTTEINTPFGPVTVTHPENATQDQILRFAKQKHQERVDRRAEIQSGFETATGLSDNPVENLFAGAGKFLVDRGRGIGQLLGRVDQSEIDEAQRLDKALMESKAGLAGNVLGGAAFTAPLALVPGAATALGGTAIGAGLGFTDPVTSGDSRLANTALGAGGGFLGHKLGQTLTQRAGSGLNTAEQQVLKDADELGFRTTAGVSMGNRPMQRVEAALESKPFSSGPIEKIKSDNQTLANRIVAESIGETDDVVNQATLNRAFSRIGDVFDEIAENTPDRVLSTAEGVRMGQFLSDLQEEFLDVTNTPVLNNALVNRFSKLVANGTVTGRQLQSLTSKLGTKASRLLSSPTGDKDLGLALLKVKDKVDDIIEAGLSGDDVAAFQQAREQWRNISRLTSRQTNINPSTGNVNLNSIASTLQKGDPYGFLRGNDNSPLNLAARFGQAFRPIVGDSGTATRQVGAVDFVTGLPINIASRAFFSRPVQSGLATGGTAISNIGNLLGPAADPRLLGLLGATAATSQ